MTLTLYRIVSYFNRLYYPDDYGDDLDLDFDQAEEEVQFHLDDGIGSHWTDDPNIAVSFATPNVNYVAILWEAEIDEDDIVPDEEIQSEYGEEGVMPFWYEREHFVRPGSQVKVTSAWVYPDLVEDNDWYIPVFGMRNVVEASIRKIIAEEVDYAGLLWDVEKRRGKWGVETWSTFSNEYWDAIYYVAEWFGEGEPWDAKVLINPRLFLEKLGYEVLWSDKNHSEYSYSESKSNKDALVFLSNFEKWVSTNSGKQEVEEWALQHTGVRPNTAAALPPLTPKQRELLKDLQNYDEVIKYDTYDRKTQKSLLALEEKGLVETRWDAEEENRLWVLWAYPNPRYRKYDASTIRFSKVELNELMQYEGEQCAKILNDGSQVGEVCWEKPKFELPQVTWVFIEENSRRRGIALETLEYITDIYNVDDVIIGLTTSEGQALQQAWDIRKECRQSVKQYEAQADDEGWWYHSGMAPHRDTWGGYIHLGTYVAAGGREEDVLENTPHDPGEMGPKLFRVKISPKNPLNTPSDPLTDHEANALDFWESSEEFVQYPDDIGKVPKPEEQPFAVRENPAEVAWHTGFKAFTYDAIYYINEVEDPGSISVMVEDSAIVETERVDKEFSKQSNLDQVVDELVEPLPKDDKSIWGSMEEEVKAGQLTHDKISQHFRQTKDSMSGIDPNAELAFEDRKGKCYEFAGRYLINNPGSVLIHGTIEGMGNPPIGHAWVVDTDGEVFEPTTGEHYSEVEFRLIFNPVAEREYDSTEAQIEMVQEGNWGPWHDTAGKVKQYACKEDSYMSAQEPNPKRDEKGWIKLYNTNNGATFEGRVVITVDHPLNMGIRDMETGEVHKINRDVIQIVDWQPERQDIRQPEVDSRGNCLGSGQRVQLSVAEEIAKEANCRECSKPLRVRPVRSRDQTGIEATIPQHKPQRKAHSHTQVNASRGEEGKLREANSKEVDQNSEFILWGYSKNSDSNSISQFGWVSSREEAYESAVRDMAREGNVEDEIVLLGVKGECVSREEYTPGSPVYNYDIECEYALVGEEGEIVCAEVVAVKSEDVERAITAGLKLKRHQPGEYLDESGRVKVFRDESGYWCWGLDEYQEEGFARKEDARQHCKKMLDDIANGRVDEDITTAEDARELIGAPFGKHESGKESEREGMARQMTVHEYLERLTKHDFSQDEISLKRLEAGSYEVYFNSESVGIVRRETFFPDAYLWNERSPEDSWCWYTHDKQSDCGYGNRKQAAAQLIKHLYRKNRLSAREADSPLDNKKASDLFDAFLNEWSENVWGFSLDSELEEEGIFSEIIFIKSLGGVIEYDEFNDMFRAGIIIQPIEFMQNVYGIKEGRDFPSEGRPESQGHKVIDDTDDLLSFDEAEEWVKEWPKDNRGILLREAEYWYEFFQKKFPEHLASREAMPRHRPGLYEYFDEMSDGTKVSIMVERLDEDTGREPGDYGFNWWTYEIQRSDDLSPIATTGDVGIFPTKRDAIENARNFIEVAYKDPQWGWVVGSGSPLDKEAL